jgi:hypothetical protein
MPWVIESTKVSLEVRNPGLTSATLLDINGYARHGAPVHKIDGGIKLEVPWDAMYVVLEKKG